MQEPRQERREPGYLQLGCDMTLNFTISQGRAWLSPACTALSAAGPQFRGQRLPFLCSKPCSSLHRTFISLNCPAGPRPSAPAPAPVSSAGLHAPAPHCPSHFPSGVWLRPGGPPSAPGPGPGSRLSCLRFREFSSGSTTKGT